MMKTFRTVARGNRVRFFGAWYRSKALMRPPDLAGEKIQIECDSDDIRTIESFRMDGRVLATFEVDPSDPLGKFKTLRDRLRALREMRRLEHVEPIEICRTRESKEKQSCQIKLTKDPDQDDP